MKSFFKIISLPLLFGILVAVVVMVVMWGGPCETYTPGICPFFRCGYKMLGQQASYLGEPVWICMPTAKNLRRCPVSKVVNYPYFDKKIVYTFDGPWKGGDTNVSVYYSDEVDEKWIQKNCPPPEVVDFQAYEANLILQIQKRFP